MSTLREERCRTNGRINPNLKQRWVKALRSGEYNQGDEYLCDSYNNFCCLGVLADIEYDGDWIKDNKSDVWGLRGTNRQEPETNIGFENICKHFLPTNFANKCGLSIETQEDLADLNDSGDSFETIAEWIDCNL